MNYRSILCLGDLWALFQLLLFAILTFLINFLRSFGRVDWSLWVCWMSLFIFIIIFLFLLISLILTYLCFIFALALLFSYKLFKIVRLGISYILLFLLNMLRFSLCRFTLVFDFKILVKKILNLNLTWRGTFFLRLEGSSKSVVPLQWLFWLFYLVFLFNYNNSFFKSLLFFSIGIDLIFDLVLN